MIGKTISHYEITEKIGHGGMGVLYKAHDTRLNRTVAIKIIRPDAIRSAERTQRFVQEARSASALNHPNIVTIYDIDHFDDVHFIAMEYVAGKPLSAVIPDDGLPIDDVLAYACQMTDALAAAHGAGIVHRDIKPANIMVTEKGQIKVLDFGLAKLLDNMDSGDDVDTSAPTRSVGFETEEGVVVGTASYMSPEQAEGARVDRRTDVFSLGSVLYEMLTGRRAFLGESAVSTRMAVLQKNPSPPIRSARREVPAELERIVGRCLEKDRSARYDSAAELRDALEELRSRRVGETVSAGALLRQPKFAIPVVGALLAIVAAGAWLFARSSRISWARNEALPEIARLAEDGDPIEAFRLARELEALIPEDPELERLRNVTRLILSVVTEPPGADVYWKDYDAVDGDWEHAGQTPLVDQAFPVAYLRVRIAKEAYRTVESSLWPFGEIDLPLSLDDEAPPEMTYVPGGSQVFGASQQNLKDFWLDRYEVTNRDFKAFVDAGGYRNREYWREPFVKNGEELSWEQAMAELVDQTGRPGPSTWELASYLDGKDDFPVSGVSWYEAAAYAAFAGKSLPTVYHWVRATDFIGSAGILALSNFDGDDVAERGSHHGHGPYGNYDMAGNVKEWCWNSVGERRYILGGAFGEPSYRYTDRDAQSPFDRTPKHGFRLMKLSEPLEAGLLKSVEKPFEAYANAEPVEDDVFDIFRSMHEYDSGPLNTVTESAAQGAHGKTEIVSFDAAYGNERMLAYLYLPDNVRPPYQAVVFFPGSNALIDDAPGAASWLFIEFIIRSGRALVLPIFQGTYERRNPSSPSTSSGPRARRDRIIEWSKDLGRTIDYLETRDDIEASKIGFYGLSMGAIWGPVGVAVEDRLKACVLLAGGMSSRRPLPEADPFNFIPRITIPTLMLNGRDDFGLPVEESQKLMLRLLGSPADEKKHVLWDAAHIPPRIGLIKETLDWFDLYLGPVDLVTTPSSRSESGS